LHGKKSGSFFPGFHRNKHWSLPIGAAASFTGSFAADNGVIQLNQVGKPIDAAPMGHGLPDLAQYGAGCDPGNTQMLGCSKRGNATFVRSHEIDGPEPFDQGNFGGVKQGVGGYRDLMTTVCALIQMARGNRVCFHTAACGALESFGPTNLGQCLGAFALRTEKFLPFYQTDFGHLHGKTSFEISL
jgi:hypothetical protein